MQRPVQRPVERTLAGNLRWIASGNHSLNWLRAAGKSLGRPTAVNISAAQLREAGYAFPVLDVTPDDAHDDGYWNEYDACDQPSDCLHYLKFKKLKLLGVYV